MDYINGTILKSIYKIFHQLEFKYRSSRSYNKHQNIFYLFSSIPFIFPALKISINAQTSQVIYNNHIFSTITVTLKNECEAEMIPKEFSFREIYSLRNA